MAVLWQIGVQFIQGYFVNEPSRLSCARPHLASLLARHYP